VTLRLVHALAAMVFVVAILVQAFLAGAALLQLGGNGDFRTHVDFGYTAVGLAALAVVVTAALARVGRRRIGYSVLLLDEPVYRPDRAATGEKLDPVDRGAPPRQRDDPVRPRGVVRLDRVARPRRRARAPDPGSLKEPT